MGDDDSPDTIQGCDNACDAKNQCFEKIDGVTDPRNDLEDAVANILIKAHGCAVGKLVSIGLFSSQIQASVSVSPNAVMKPQ